MRALAPLTIVFHAPGATTLLGEEESLLAFVDCVWRKVGKGFLL